MKWSATAIACGAVFAMPAAPNPVDAQAPDFPSRLAGSWLVTQFVIGPGFGGGTFPMPDAPPTVVKQDGTGASFSDDLQTGVGTFGVAEKESAAYALRCVSARVCALSVTSKAWLQLKDFPLAAQGDSMLTGAGTIAIGRDTLPLRVTITLTKPAGHKWLFTATGHDGKPAHRLELTFKRVGDP